MRKTVSTWGAIIFLMLTGFVMQGCATLMGLNTPERHQGTHRILAGTRNEVRAGVQAVFEKMGSDFSISEQGSMIKAVYNKSGVVLAYKARFSPGPDAGRTDVEMICEMPRMIDGDAVTQCETNFLAGVADAVEFTRLRKADSASGSARGVDEPKVVTIKSDVDEPPVKKVKTNSTFYGIVIGIENYRQKLPKADFATNDARAVAAYLTSALGYPEENVVTLMDERASLGDITKYIEKWLPNNIEKDGSVFVYYSGHGAPNSTTGDAYLVPYDGDPTFIEQTGYPLKRLYENLNKLQAKEVVVVLDSCFSGAGGRSVIAKGVRPLVLTKETAGTGKVTVLTAASADQTSSTYDDKGHGLFTYFLLKAIREENVTEKDGSARYEQLMSYISPKVERIARKQYNNEQTPQLIKPVTSSR